MKAAFVVYHNVLEEKVSGFLSELKIDFYTHWDHVTGKGHSADPHLGTRTFPGHNNVKLLAFSAEEQLNELIPMIQEYNKTARRKDDEIRLFLIPLEKII